MESNETNEAPILFGPSTIDVAYDTDDIVTASFKPMTVLRSKVLVVGDAECGKTSLLRHFLSRNYAMAYDMTTDVDLVVGEVPVPKTNVTVDLFLYDMPGAEAFAEERSFPAEADFVVCCFDVSSRGSFGRCHDWIGAATASSDAEVLLVATKADFREGAARRAEVAEEEGREFAEARGCRYFECSAAKSMDTRAPFEYIAKRVWERYTA